MFPRCLLLVGFLAFSELASAQPATPKPPPDLQALAATLAKQRFDNWTRCRDMTDVAPLDERMVCAKLLFSLHEYDDVLRLIEPVRSADATVLSGKYLYRARSHLARAEFARARQAYDALMQQLPQASPTFADDNKRDIEELAQMTETTRANGITSRTEFERAILKACCADKSANFFTTLAPSVWRSYERAEKRKLLLWQREATFLGARVSHLDQDDYPFGHASVHVWLRYPPGVLRVLEQEILDGKSMVHPDLGPHMTVQQRLDYFRRVHEVRHLLFELTLKKHGDWFVVDIRLNGGPFYSFLQAMPSGGALQGGAVAAGQVPTASAKQTQGGSVGNSSRPPVVAGLVFFAALAIGLLVALGRKRRRAK